MRRLVRDFRYVLAAETVAGLGVRVAYVLTVGRHLKFGLDAVWYMLVAGSLASGHGYSNPVLLYTYGVERPTANFAPGYPVFLTALHGLGITTPTGFQLTGAVCGSATILMTGILGRRLTGRAGVGLLAAAIVAFCPALVSSDASVMSETIAVPLVTAVLLTAVYAAERPTLGRWILAGFLAGLVALVRSEDLLVVLVLVPALALAASPVPVRRRLLQAGAAVLIGALTVSPWLIRNYVTFTPSVLFSTNDGKTWAGSNCPTTFSGPLIGYWDNGCLGYPQLANADEAKYDKVLRAQGTAYVRAHLSRVPLVVAVRVLRGWGLYNPAQEARLEAMQSRSAGWQQFAWPFSVLLLLGGLVGFWRLRRDRFALVLLAGPALVATVVVAVSFGNPRYVEGALPSLCIATAIAVIGRSSAVRSGEDAEPGRV